jgi:hypothetical protein
MILRRAESTLARGRKLRGLTRHYVPNASSAEQPEPAEGPASRKPGVLVAEVDGSVRTVLGMLLRQHGFAVWQASGIAEALEILRREPAAVDVVLLDEELAPPEGPGAAVEALQGIRPGVRCCLLGGRGEQAPAAAPPCVARVFSRPFRLAEMARELLCVVADEDPTPAPAPAEPEPVVLDVTLAPEDERRADPRYRCALEQQCQPLGAGPSGEHWRGYVRDISTGGARVILGRRFEVGTVLMLAMSSVSGTHSQRLLARVVRLSEEATGQWSLGCTFTRPLAPEDLQDLLA